MYALLLATVIAFVPTPGADFCLLEDSKTGTFHFSQPPESPEYATLPMPPPGVLARVRCVVGTELSPPAIWGDGRRATTLFWGGPVLGP